MGGASIMHRYLLIHYEYQLNGDLCETHNSPLTLAVIAEMCKILYPFDGTGPELSIVSLDAEWNYDYGINERIGKYCYWEGLQI
jgi:hypothetical protein